MASLNKIFQNNIHVVWGGNDGWMDACVDGWMGWWDDGWMDG